MSLQSPTRGEIQAYVRRLGNPYALLAFIDDEPQVTGQQKRAYFKNLQNPHAFDAIFGEPSDIAPASGASIESELDAVLSLYKSHVARSEWDRVSEYRPSFLAGAKRSRKTTEELVTALRSFRFTLLPNERVEYNRAPAEAIIRALKELLA